MGFFVNMAGKANAFRLYDHLDHGPVVAAPAAVIAGSSNTQWQLQRPRTLAGYTYYQPIAKPIASYTKQDQDGNAAAGGIPILDYQGHIVPNTIISITAGDGASAGDYVLDATTGIVTLSAAPGVLPALATFSYHYPVRFDVDQLDLQVEPSAVGRGDPLVTLNSVPLVEVAPPNF